MRLVFAPVRIAAASVRGVAWSRAAFGRRPRPVVVVTRPVVVHVTVLAIPPRPDRVTVPVAMGALTSGGRGFIEPMGGEG